MYWTKTPSFIIRHFESFLWRKDDVTEKCVYLTFDDGPCLGVTDRLLKILDDKQVSATFFCLGSAINQYPIIFQSIIDAGHSVGYHGWDHINGWKSTRKEFLANAKKGLELTPSKLFRPPYGKIPFSAKKQLSQFCDVIMWDIMSGDFNPKLSAETCIENVMKNVQPGSIIVLHDNIKSSQKMLQIVPEIIERLRKESYTFGRL